MDLKQLKHSKFKIIDKIAVVVLSSPKSKVNILNKEVMDEFYNILNNVKDNPQIHAVILISEKPGCFIAGADINMLEKFKTADEATQAARECQEIFKFIENNEKPVIAAIQGCCLGAGVEAVLACHYRIAAKDKKTRLGLPEVMIGLLPGAGGTQRLQRVTSLTNALDMILTGKSITAEKANECGVVDMLVDPLPGLDIPEKQMRRFLEKTAIGVAKKLVNGDLNKNKKNLYNKLFEHALQYNWVKNKVFDKAREQIMKISAGLYPAPLRILDVVRIGCDKGIEAGFEAEAKAFGELMMTPESKSLLSLFRAQTECKKNRFGEPKNTIKNIGVVGAGLMGGGIAYVSLNRGFNVMLKDASEDALERCSKKIHTIYYDGVKRKRFTSLERDLILSKLSSTLSYEDFHNADMIIEAVFEDVKLKQRIIRDLENVVSSDCIIASNTSAIPITKIAENSSRPDRIIGMHYFSPVDKMQLLEVVRTEKNSDDVIAAAVVVGLRQGKVVITVRDSPGFFTTRILTTMLFELVRLLQEGIEPKRLDKLTKQFGFPVGIVTLIDEIGLDVITHIMTELAEAFGERFSGGSVDLMRDLVRAGFLGRKTGKGIFTYERNSKNRSVNPGYVKILKKYCLKPEKSFSDDDKILRMVSRFVNETVLCLEDKIIRNIVEGNVGAVFGLGFPPFTGGPFRWIDSFGADKLVSKMKAYKAVYGAPFKPAETLIKMANNSDLKFHSMR